MRVLIWLFFRWFLFQLEAESAHYLVMRLLKCFGFLGGFPLRWVSGVRLVSLTQRKFPIVCGIEFLSQVGLAAGFDKNAEILTCLPHLGFGFVEIGTVTPSPQPGNPRPRLFRDEKQQALFNRMGFNNLGAEIIAQRLRRARPMLPSRFRVGVNLGKNRDTPLEQAAFDYAKSAQFFEGLADYLVINVSSPNTPGLKSLQTVEALQPIIVQVQEVIRLWQVSPPIFLKLAPELEKDELKKILYFTEQFGVQGFILTNSLSGKSLEDRSLEQGGWSGGPLTEISRGVLEEARRHTQLPLISAGGILSVQEAARRVQIGAVLVQMYTGWIFQGPTFPLEVDRKLKSLGLTSEASLN